MFKAMISITCCGMNRPHPALLALNSALSIFSLTSVVSAHYELVSDGAMENSSNIRYTFSLPTGSDISSIPTSWRSYIGYAANTWENAAPNIDIATTTSTTIKNRIYKTSLGSYQGETLRADPGLFSCFWESLFSVSNILRSHTLNLPISACSSSDASPLSHFCLKNVSRLTGSSPLPAQTRACKTPGCASGSRKHVSCSA